MIRPWSATLLSALLMSLPTSPSAQLPAPPAPACTTPAHRQFDFWLGDWVVTHPDTGAELGRNTITAGAGSCLLHEDWRGGSGYTGQSLNAWDAARGVWTQHWVGADGLVLRLEGGLVDGAMVLEGQLATAAGGVQHQRITWTPDADGSVRQHWQTSDDAGRSWQTSFVGVYRRA